MKIKSFRRFNPEDFPGFDEEQKKLLGGLNDALEPMNTALRGNLSFRDNFRAESKVLKVSEDSTFTLRSALRCRLRYVLFGISELFDYADVTVRRVSDQEVDLSVSFDTAPISPVEVEVLLIGE